MKKLIILTMFLAFLLVISVNALNFSSTRGFQWLYEKEADSGSYENKVSSTALAVLAYDSAGADTQTVAPMDWVNSQEDSKYCFPKGACKVKDTALAIIALDTLGHSTVFEENWLINAQSTSSAKGDWWLQIVTKGSGTCTVTYEKNNKTITKDIIIEDGNLTGTKDTNHLDLNTELEPNLITSKPTIDLFVDCSDLSSSAIISLIYHSDLSYYILDESTSSTASLFINNGCFGQSASSTCDYESTLYALWALNKIESKISPSPSYIETYYDNSKTLHNAILFLTSGSAQYSDALKDRQKSDGSWDSVYNTALAVLALKTHDETEIADKATEYLKESQALDGSWNQNIQDTAMVLYSAFTENALPTCTDGIQNGNEEGEDCGGSCLEPCEQICNFDGYCQEEFGEDCNNCPEDCSSCDAYCGDGSCDSSEDKISCPEDCQIETCTYDGICDTYLGENSDNCPSDCECGDGVCDDLEYEFEDCPEDCEAQPDCECKDDFDCPVGETCDGCDCISETPSSKEKERSLTWLWILLVLVVAILIYILYSKKKGKDPLRFLKKKGPKIPPGPRSPFRPTPIPGVKPYARRPMVRGPPPRLTPFRRR